MDSPCNIPLHCSSRLPEYGNLKINLALHYLVNMIPLQNYSSYIDEILEVLPETKNRVYDECLHPTQSPHSATVWLMLSPSKSSIWWTERK